MNFKKIILFVAACLILLIFFNTTFYSNWFQTKIYRAWESEAEVETFDYQWNHMDPVQRKIDKLSSTYTFSQQVAEFLKKKGAKNPLVLLPTQDYMKERQIDLLIPEPIVFYYHCGVKGAWYNSANVNQADWAIVGKNGELTIIPIQNQAERDTIIASYKSAFDKANPSTGNSK